MRELEWFENIREIMGGEDEIIDYPTLNAQNDFLCVLLEIMAERLKIDKVLNPIGKLLGIKSYEKVLYTKAVPMSMQMRLWAYEDVREFNQPYVKKVYQTDKVDLSKNGYAEWVSNRIASIGKNSTNVSTQLLHID